MCRQHLSWSLALLTTGWLTGCASVTPPAKTPPNPTQGLIADDFVPGLDGKISQVPMVVESLPPLPEAGPIELTLAECLDRASRVGRLDDESVQAWRLARKIGEIGATVAGSRFSTEVMRENLGQGPGAEAANLGFRIAILEYRKKLAKLALTVEQACWTLRSNLPAVTQANTALERVQASAQAEEAQIALGNLLGICSEQARRLVIRDFPLPNIPQHPEQLLDQVVECHPDLTIARLREDIERRTRGIGDGEVQLDNRLRWLHAQQCLTDTQARLRCEGERLIRRWRQAQQLLAASQQSPLDASPGERTAARRAEREAERELGLVQIELARWLAHAEKCQPACCPADAVPVTSSGPSPGPG